MKFETVLKEVGEYGVVEQVRHSTVIVSGLPNAFLHELVLFESGHIGEVFAVEKDFLQILTFSKQFIKPGTKVTRTNKTVSVPVGKELLGQAINPLGESISAKEYHKPSLEKLIDNPPLGMSERSRIKLPFLTGVSAIDMMIPLGKGQKELIIGDRKSGKTAFLLTTIKNQAQLGTICIYAAVGRKMSDIKKAIDFFKQEGILKQVIIVTTAPNDSPSLIFQTPYSAMSIAEYFKDQGKDVLVVIDDLTTHARYYREISLLSKRFPGRDSYPGDIFYAHARLIERAGNFKSKTQDVSITALPVAEIIEGDFTSYIATNLMAMTDGHIYFDSNIYYRGRRPAINFTLSVTRVGRQAQTKLLRDINHHLTAFFAQYEKLHNLGQFGVELTDEVKLKIKTAEQIYTFFNQQFGLVLPLAVQVALFALIWTHSFEELHIQDVLSYKKNLVDAYGKHPKDFENLLKMDDLANLSAKVNSSRNLFLKLCKTYSN